MEDIHGIAQKGENSPKHAFPSDQYVYRDFPRMVYSRGGVKVVHTADDLAKAVAEGFSLAPVMREEPALAEEASIHEEAKKQE